MTTIEERIAALEQLFHRGLEEHEDIAATLEKLTAQVSKLRSTWPTATTATSPLWLSNSCSVRSSARHCGHQVAKK